MDVLNIMSYGGIITLIVLLIIFEVKGRQGGSYNNNSGYIYYTYNNIAVRIRHLAASRYKIYVNDFCPIQTKKDRYGTYFNMRACSASDAEYQIDELFRNC